MCVCQADYERRDEITLICHQKRKGQNLLLFYCI
uniref:Uncharacterized protein n=1 Tax=Anguilla anguilla TaxID=7936 RepID=A0A0E9VFB8_ANGAN